MRVRVLVVVSICLVSAAWAGAAFAAAHRWDSYANARYGYRICYPADLMVPQREADNGDGRVFTASGGATLRVWGNYNANEESLATITDTLPNRGAVVTYRRVEARRSVISGKSGGDIFYAETLLGTDDAVRHFILTYPTAQAVTFDPIAKRLSRCFEPVAH